VSNLRFTHNFIKTFVVRGCNYRVIIKIDGVLIGLSADKKMADWGEKNLAKTTAHFRLKK